MQSKNSYLLPLVLVTSLFFLCGIVGGAIVPYVMGSVAEAYDTAAAYAVPMACFFIVALFGIFGYKTKSDEVLPHFGFKG